MPGPTSVMSPDSFASFGDLLKYLRRRERLTQLDLSIAVGYSEGQISRLEKNQRLPDLAALKALFVPALHLENEPALAARLLVLAESARQEDTPMPGLAPYKGLLFFDEPDADWFFGREALTAHLVDRVNQVASNPPRLLAVVGASGSGKSSVVRAGLSVACKRTGWQTRVWTPTAQPLHALSAITQIPSSFHASPTLVIVDQFEEVFTLCHDEGSRAEFIAQLIALANRSDAPMTFVIVLRADFYAHCAQYPELRKAIAAQQEYIGQMTREELRCAIEEPAKRNNWDLEPGLVELMLGDIGAGRAQDQEPGALPLLSHALLETWERRRGRTLTLEGYRAAGGVHGAIAETAESVYTDQLNPPQQQLAREIFLRLTELGEGTEDTRRRAPLTELEPHAEEAAQLRPVLNALANARLVILAEDHAEVAHEALIREWRRLRGWLNEDREGLRLHRHLTEDAHEWERLDRDPGALYRGARLAQALEWRQANEPVLNDLERMFLEASAAYEQKELREKEAQRQRELQAAQQLAEEQKQRAEEQTRTAKQLRRRSYFLSGAFLLATILALTALFFGDQAQQAQRIATAREVAGSANNNLDIDPERSILLARQAISISSAGGQPVIREAEEALHRAITASRVQLTLGGHTNAVHSVAYSPDGTRIATMASNDGVRVWDSVTGKELLFLRNEYRFAAGPVKTISFSPDGKFLATAFGERQIRIWNAMTGEPLQTLSGHSRLPTSLNISPDGKQLASGGGDGTIEVWDVGTGQELRTIPGHTDNVLSIVFSPDGKRLGTGSFDRTAKVWDVSTGQLLVTLTGHADRVNAVAFTPDATRLISASGDTTIRIWDLATGRTTLTLFGHVSLVVGLGIDSKGARIITGSEDGTAKVWDLATGQNLLTLSGHSSGVGDVAFSPDGIHVVTGSRDRTARVWDISGAGGHEWNNLTGHTDLAVDVAYSLDGKRLATASHDKTIKIWDTESGKELQTLSEASPVQAVRFSPDGTRLATKGGDGFVRVWDMATGKELLKITTEQIPTAGEIARIGLAFSPDGRRLATGSGGNAAKLWDVPTGQEVVTFTGHTGPVYRVAFSPDGTRLATASSDMTAKVWDAMTGKELVTLGGHTGIVGGVAFSRDGKYVATTGNDGTVRVWDVTSGKEAMVLTGHTGSVFGVAFSPDGKRLASTSVDKTIKIWDVSHIGGQVQEPLTLYGHTAAVFQVAWSPDGTRLATASRDRTVRVWALNLDDLIAVAKARVTRTLTADECQKYLHLPVCPP